MIAGCLLVRTGVRPGDRRAPRGGPAPAPISRDPRSAPRPPGVTGPVSLCDGPREAVTRLEGRQPCRDT
ncbi:hypothetical protein GCM10017600_77010 [Streptosporangium carneum]|uniref:Uncharacterized protein n=1 Tax=Streptosporangium carneum TaxID=47481 RepID=A0A9W6MGY5_9ACTN|nr:hypothetical protein GCM10017600_77010 [Streptosporangium carneum]